LILQERACNCFTVTGFAFIPRLYESPFFIDKAGDNVFNHRFSFVVNLAESLIESTLHKKRGVVALAMLFIELGREIKRVVDIKTPHLFPNAEKAKMILVHKLLYFIRRTFEGIKVLLMCS